MEVIQILSMGTRVDFFGYVSALFLVVVGMRARKPLRDKNPQVPRARESRRLFLVG